MIRHEHDKSAPPAACFVVMARRVEQKWSQLRIRQRDGLLAVGANSDVEHGARFHPARHGMVQTTGKLTLELIHSPKPLSAHACVKVERIVPMRFCTAETKQAAAPSNALGQRVPPVERVVSNTLFRTSTHAFATFA